MVVLSFGLLFCNGSCPFVFSKKIQLGVGGVTLDDSAINFVSKTWRRKTLFKKHPPKKYIYRKRCPRFWESKWSELVNESQRLYRQGHWRKERIYGWRNSDVKTKNHVTKLGSSYQLPKSKDSRV
jgi:hypothetical protein